MTTFIHVLNLGSFPIPKTMTVCPSKLQTFVKLLAYLGFMVIWYFCMRYFMVRMSFTWIRMMMFASDLFGSLTFNMFKACGKNQNNTNHIGWYKKKCSTYYLQLSISKEITFAYSVSFGKKFMVDKLRDFQMLRI